MKVRSEVSLPLSALRFINSRYLSIHSDFVSFSALGTRTNLLFTDYSGPYFILSKSVVSVYQSLGWQDEETGFDVVFKYSGEQS